MVTGKDLLHRFTLREKTLISFAIIGEDSKQLSSSSDITKITEITPMY